MGSTDISQSGSFQIQDGYVVGTVSYVLNTSAGIEYYFGKNVVCFMQVIDSNGQVVVLKQNGLYFTNSERDELINFREYIGKIGDVKVELYVIDSINNARPVSMKKTLNLKGVEPEPEPCQEGYERINGTCLKINGCYCNPNQICNNGTCLDNNGTKKEIVNQDFTAGAITKPVTFVNSEINIPLQQGEHVIYSRLYTKVVATRVGASIADLFFTSQVKIDVNGQRKDSLNLEPEFFNFSPQTKESDVEVSLRDGKNTIKYELDFGLASLKYNLYSDIFVKLNTGRSLNISVNNKVEDLDEGSKVLNQLKLPTALIAVALAGVFILSQSGSRTIVYKGAKAGYKRLRK